MPDVPAAPAATAPDDLGADLSSAYDSVVGDSSSGSSAPAPSASPSAGANQPSSSPEGAGGDAARARGPDGKFIQKTAAPATAAPVDPNAPPGTAPVAAPEFKVPEKWPADVRAKLEGIHKANPEHAQFLLDQYAHFRQIDKTREGQINARLKPLDDLLAAGRQQRALQNIDDVTYVRNLVAAGDLLDKNPEQGIKWLAQRYGLDLQKIANPQAAGQQPEMPPELRQTREELQQIKQFIAQQQQEADRQREGAAANWLTSFASQKDGNGQPLYPHFDECINEILVCVQDQKTRGAQVDLHAAYQRAVRMNDTVWLKDQAARSEAARKADEARHRQAVEDAKRAGFNASGSGGASSDTPAESLRGELERQYDKKFS